MKKLKICLTSTVSCGKTTLIKALSQEPEFKDYFIATERSQYLRDLGIPLNTDSTFKGQILFLAERTSELMRDSLLSDRGIVDVMAFTNLAKSINDNEKFKLNKLCKELIKEYDYIFYISPEGLPIEDNGVREINPEYRLQIDEEIQKLLINYKDDIKNLYEISGSTQERIKKIKEIIF